MLKGYSLPLSPGGRSSLVPSPPWHYVGDLMVIEYWADPEAVRAVLPPGLEPHPTDPGRAAAIFADWQSCTDGGSELLDPARSQYMEFFIVVNALLGGKEVTTCPYIWVDRDFALMRGWFQGFPKKLGSVWMTRHFGLQNGAEPGLQPGATFGGTLRRQRPPPGPGHGHAREHHGLRPDAQRAAARQRAPLPAPQRRPARQAGRARAGGRAQPRPLDLGDLGGRRPRSSSSARPTRSTPRSRPCAWARASASRSPTRWTTSPTRATCGRRTDGGARNRAPARARRRSRRLGRPLHRRTAGRERRDVRGPLAARLVAARRGLARRRRDRGARRRRRGRRVSRPGPRSAPPAAPCTSSGWPI